MISFKTFGFFVLTAVSASVAHAETFKDILGTPNLEDIEYPDEEMHTKAEIELGKQLFYDRRLSKNKDMSCATCHNLNTGTGDALKTAIGDDGKILGRNTPHIYNLAWNTVFFWDGRASSLEEQALGPIQAAGEMNMDLKGVVSRLKKVNGYVSQFKKVYNTNVTSEGIGKAIAAFERTIVSDNSAYDKYVAGDKAAMTPAEIRGLKLFVGKAKCASCHSGYNFTDESFHNIGLNSKDKGRYAVVKGVKMQGAFKTPGLRNVLLTAPYMHNGSLATLEEVVEHYNTGGKKTKNLSTLMFKLNLNKREIADLVAFLGALTDPVIIEAPKLPE